MDSVNQLRGVQGAIHRPVLSMPPLHARAAAPRLPYHVQFQNVTTRAYPYIRRIISYWTCLQALVVRTLFCYPCRRVCPFNDTTCTITHSYVPVRTVTHNLFSP